MRGEVCTWGRLTYCGYARDEGGISHSLRRNGTLRNQLHPQVDSDIRAARQRNDRLRSVHQFLLEVAVDSQSPEELEDLLVEIDSAAALIRNMASVNDDGADEARRGSRRSWAVREDQEQTDTSPSEGFIEALRAAEQATKEREAENPIIDAEWAEPKPA